MEPTTDISAVPVMEEDAKSIWMTEEPMEAPDARLNSRLWRELSCVSHRRDIWH